MPNFDTNFVGNFGGNFGPKFAPKFPTKFEILREFRGELLVRNSLRISVGTSNAFPTKFPGNFAHWPESAIKATRKFGPNFDSNFVGNFGGKLRYELRGELRRNSLGTSPRSSQIMPVRAGPPNRLLPVSRKVTWRLYGGGRLRLAHQWWSWHSSFRCTHRQVHGWESWPARLGNVGRRPEMSAQTANDAKMSAGRRKCRPADAGDGE